MTEIKKKKNQIDYNETSDLIWNMTSAEEFCLVGVIKYLIDIFRDINFFCLHVSIWTIQYCFH